MNFVTNLKISDDLVKISINGITHICFRYSKFVGFQTWIDPEESRWKIEICLQDGFVQSHYDKKEKFIAVLKQLEKVVF